MVQEFQRAHCLLGHVVDHFRVMVPVDDPDRYRQFGVLVQIAGGVFFLLPFFAFLHDALHFYFAFCFGVDDFVEHFNRIINDVHVRFFMME